MTGKELMSLLPENKSDILPYCSRTTCWEFVTEMMVARLNANTKRFTYDSVSLDINTYPFVLTAQENTAIEEVFSEMCGGLFEVKCVHIPPQALSSSFVAKTYSDLVMYDPAEWLASLGQSIYKCELRDVVLYAPGVFQIRDLTEEEMAIQRTHGMTINDAMVDLLAPVLTLRFLPVCLFCVESPLNQVKKTTR